MPKIGWRRKTLNPAFQIVVRLCSVPRVSSLVTVARRSRVASGAKPYKPSTRNRSSSTLDARCPRCDRERREVDRRDRALAAVGGERRVVDGNVLPKAQVLRAEGPRRTSRREDVGSVV